MTGNYAFIAAMELLGYSSDADITNNALTYVNKVYAELYRIAHPKGEFKPLERLTDKLELPLDMGTMVMPLGVAELIALGRGDGELQQYFALDYDRAKAKFNVDDSVVYVI